MHHNTKLVKPASRPNSVLITSGFKNFHMTSAAAEAQKQSRLVGLVCGFYPKRVFLRFAVPDLLAASAKFRKLIGRRVEVSDSLIYSIAIPEMIFDLGGLLSRCRWLSRVGVFLECCSMRLFAKSASRVLRSKGKITGLYHFRAGFGSTSIDVADALGIRTLCDHSIVHPQLLDGLVDSSGRISYAKNTDTPLGIWRLVQHDIDAAQYVLVNSDFVKRTFQRVGFKCSKVFVAYQGVDDAFLETIPKRMQRENDGVVRFLFAGNFGLRKGGHILLEALQQLPTSGWEMMLAGTIEPSFVDRLRALEGKYPVHHVGNLDRAALARLMSESDIFVFPTFAEGSARVVFEAMACGCFVITTENAGSIVQDGVHGILVAPGDVLSLTTAMISVLSSRSIGAVGAENARLIREVYNQSAYGRQLGEIYDRILYDKSSEG